MKPVLYHLKKNNEMKCWIHNRCFFVCYLLRNDHKDEKQTSSLDLGMMKVKYTINDLTKLRNKTDTFKRIMTMKIMFVVLKDVRKLVIV